MTMHFRHWCSPFFVITCHLLGGQTTSATLVADVSCPRGASTFQVTWLGTWLVTCLTTWPLTWPVMWMCTCPLFIGPQGMLWVVHVSCCDWLSFSSLKWLQIHHWIDYKIVTESTTKSSQKGNKIHHRCTCWTTDHSIPITINLTDPVFIGTINLMNNTKLGSHITH